MTQNIVSHFSDEGNEIKLSLLHHATQLDLGFQPRPPDKSSYTYSVIYSSPKIKTEQENPKALRCNGHVAGVGGAHGFLSTADQTLTPILLVITCMIMGNYIF